MKKEEKRKQGEYGESGKERNAIISKKTPSIYFQPVKHTVLHHPTIVLGDVIDIFCEDRKVTDTLKELTCIQFTRGKREHRSLSVLHVIEKIRERYPDADIFPLGAAQFLISYEPKPREKASRYVVALVCLTAFFGAGISVMGYNTDIDTIKIFQKITSFFTGVKTKNPIIAELSYSIGLTLGIFVFFNHMPGKRFTDEPTPLEVQMDLYEENVEQTRLNDAQKKQEDNK